MREKKKINFSFNIVNLMFIITLPFKLKAFVESKVFITDFRF